jgi:hypothetical protein
MTTDNTNETEQLKTGPITPEEVREWENALSDADKIQLRRLQLQQVSISGAAPDKEPDWSRLSDAEFARERMKRYGF